MHEFDLNKFDLNKLIRLPISFEKVEEIEAEDTRFVKVKIHLMHTGENFNKSYFSKEVVESAIPSLANTPIVAYIEENSEGDDDFSNHRHKVVVENGKYIVKYAGSAYGVIPEANNARFETKTTEDGVEREYLVVDGLLWTKFDDPVDILNDRGGKVAQSMELDRESISGEFDSESGLFHFHSFKFNGAAMLGIDYKPGMEDASLELYTENSSGIAKEIEAKLVKYSQFVGDFEFKYNNQNESEGGNTVDEKLELIAKYSFTKEDVENKGIDLETISTEELEEKLKEFSLEDQEPKVDTEPAKGKDKPEVDFALSNKQLREHLANALNPDKYEWGGTIYKYWLVDFDSDMVYAEDIDGNYTLVGMPYAMNGDIPVINFEAKKLYKITYEPLDIPVDISYSVSAKNKHDAIVESTTAKVKAEMEAEHKTEFEALNKELSEVKAENEELKKANDEFVAKKREEEEAELFADFSTQLTDEEMAPIRETASEFTLEEIKTQLLVLVGEKAIEFARNSKTEEKQDKKHVTTSFTRDESKPVKPYAHILESYKK